MASARNRSDRPTPRSKLGGRKSRALLRGLSRPGRRRSSRMVSRESAPHSRAPGGRGNPRASLTPEREDRTCMMVKVTINCDMGEAFGIYRFGDDETCMPFVTHANIACGFHASDPSVMWRTVRAAKKYGLKIGSHPGLPDREGFGRREMKLTREEVAALVLYQTGALRAFLDTEGMSLSHIKPHGALMGMAMKYTPVAEGVADAALALGLPVIACSDSEMPPVFCRRGVRFLCGFYSDLDYDDHGRQIIAMKHEPVAPEDAV